ncbi:serpin family protein [Microcoleus sp. FACHB-672]|uniref:serpin family protein n=1 Tax=Microcoleus sp. FACHB-672 TaxID=2692825 RepID=UPI001684CE63|nr:serpin family protein [Microcoleus sp. FACHB-672]MBD2041554.1 serpin family protein [Microcoleus sp. FACHB-672]
MKQHLGARNKAAAQAKWKNETKWLIAGFKLNLAKKQQQKLPGKIKFLLLPFYLLSLTSALAFSVDIQPSRCEDAVNTGFLATLPPETSTVVNSNTGFALDLYKHLRQEVSRQNGGKEGNVFFSPYSLSTGLAMTYAGARGQTAAEMGQALHFNLPPERLHPAFAALRANIEADSRQNYQLDIANRLWGQKGYNFLEAFLEITRNFYNATLEKLDFTAAPEAARTQINQWIAQKTHEKIKDLIPPGVLSSDTRLVLTNAIYFKAAWLSPFDPSKTKNEPFTTLDGQPVPVPMMHQGGQIFGYAEIEGLQVLELPFVDNRLSLVILLPQQVDGLLELETKLTPENLTKWLSSLSSEVPISVWLPKFQLSSAFELKDALSQMGMPLAFSPNSDFSGMNGQKDLFISNVIHKTFADVNEAGTEADAATAITAATRGSGNAFKADHPFIFLIRDAESGSVLFLGRVVNPALVNY